LGEVSRPHAGRGSDPVVAGGDREKDAAGEEEKPRAEIAIDPDPHGETPPAPA